MKEGRKVMVYARLCMDVHYNNQFLHSCRREWLCHSVCMHCMSHCSIKYVVQKQFQVSLERPLPEALGHLWQSVQQCLQQREVLAVVPVVSGLGHCRQQRRHLLSHGFLLTQLCQEVDATSRERERRWRYMYNHVEYSCAL